MQKVRFNTTATTLLLLGAAALAACGDDPTNDGAGGGTAGHGVGGDDAGGQSAMGGHGGSDQPPPPPVPGLRAEYFAGYLDRVIDRIEPGIDVIWGAKGPSADVGVDRYSARWTGTLTPPESGTYTIATETDDGVRVWIDDALIIDDWRGHFVTRNTAEVTLTADQPVALRVDYFEYDLDASARLLWSTDSLPEEVIPTEYLLAAPRASELPSPKPPYQNPVIGFDCPDPGVLASSDLEPEGYVAVCTGGRFPIRRSRSLVTWEDAGAQILPDGKPAWAANGNRNWAPEIHRVGDHYVAYYTTVNGSNVLSIGAASADGPLGPWTHQAGPLVQHSSGVIDATYFEDDDGSRWLIYKIDGNAHGQPTPILARQLEADGLSFAPGSTAVELLRNNANTWEGGVVEAQWIVKRDGVYYMFYSGNVYDHRYRTGVARSNQLLGPYEKHGPPILANNERWVGPGHGSIVTTGGMDYFVYHAWTNAGNGTNTGGRNVLVDRIQWVDGWPVIHDGTPSRSPQPWPGSTP